MAVFPEMSGGKVADYIPELAKADPDWFGIAVATVDGQVYEVGDSEQPFTIQSISKPFIYGLALEDNGREQVLSKVGVEPTGEAFNSIVLERRTNRPFNPMVNAGAIAAAAWSRATGPSRASQRCSICSRALRRPRSWTIDKTVFASERATGHRNRAIAHLMLQLRHDRPADPTRRSTSISSSARSW